MLAYLLLDRSGLVRSGLVVFVSVDFCLVLLDDLVVWEVNVPWLACLPSRVVECDFSGLDSLGNFVFRRGGTGLFCSDGLFVFRAGLIVLPGLVVLVVICCIYKKGLIIRMMMRQEVIDNHP